MVFYEFLGGWGAGCAGGLPGFGDFPGSAFLFRSGFTPIIWLCFWRLAGRWKFMTARENEGLSAEAVQFSSTFPRRECCAWRSRIQLPNPGLVVLPPKPRGSFDLFSAANAQQVSLADGELGDGLSRAGDQVGDRQMVIHHSASTRGLRVQVQYAAVIRWSDFAGGNARLSVLCGKWRAP